MDEPQAALEVGTWFAVRKPDGHWHCWDKNAETNFYIRDREDAYALIELAKKIAGLLPPGDARVRE